MPSVIATNPKFPSTNIRAKQVIGTQGQAEWQYCKLLITHSKAQVQVREIANAHTTLPSNTGGETAQFGDRHTVASMNCWHSSCLHDCANLCESVVSLFLCQRCCSNPEMIEQHPTAANTKSACAAIQTPAAATGGLTSLEDLVATASQCSLRYCMP